MARLRGLFPMVVGAVVLALIISFSGLGQAAADNLKDVFVTNDASHPVPSTINNFPLDNAGNLKTAPQGTQDVNVTGGTLNLNTPDSQPTTTFEVSIPGITGGLPDGKTAGLKFQTSMDQSGSTGGGGGGTGKATFDDIKFVKAMDTNSPILLDDAATGKHLKNVVFTFGPTVDGKQQVTETITLDDVLITHVAQNIGDLGNLGKFSTVPLESINLNFGRIHMVTATASVCWDVAALKSC